MAMQLGHVHIKTREDPQKVAKFYIDNFGATVKREIPGRGCQLDLHGVQLNVTPKDGGNTFKGSFFASGATWLSLSGTGCDPSSVMI